jgi:hypothetical protein
MPGIWVEPPSPYHSWEPARWVNENGAWVFSEGRWVDRGEPSVAYRPPDEDDIEADEAPPADLDEVRPAMPFAGAVWIPGYWRWHGHRHVWISGRWSAPVPGRTWVAGHWKHGHHGGWHYKPGHWE